MGRITGTRGDTVVREPDVVGEQQGDPNDLLINQLGNLAAKTFDTSRPVDEYQTTQGNITTIEVLPEYEMDEFIEAIIVVAPAYGAGPVPATPNSGSVLATGVAQQNVNSYPVQVVIGANGATITAVVVNGITVGVAAGTYTVPAYGAISVSYTVSTPTWVWSNAGGLYVVNACTLQLGNRYLYFNTSPSGLFYIDGLGIRLDRHDRRYLTSTVAGPLYLGLTGHADMMGSVGGS